MQNEISKEEFNCIEIRECVKAVGGSVKSEGYITDKHILLVVNNPNEVQFENLQAEIDSWGNIPVVMIGHKGEYILFEVK